MGIFKDQEWAVGFLVGRWGDGVKAEGSRMGCFVFGLVGRWGDGASSRFKNGLLGFWSEGG